MAVFIYIMGEIFNISADLNFVEELATGASQHFDDLSEVIVFVPSKAVIAQLKNRFDKMGKGQPSIFPLGDLDDLVSQASEFQNIPLPPKAISKSFRLVQISKILQSRDTEGKLDFSKAMKLAKSLCEMIDEMQNKNVSFDDLRNVVDAEFAEHWQKSLDFLKAISHNWQNIKRVNNYLEPTERRNLVIEQIAAHIRKYNLSQPLVIAGTTATINSTMELVKSAFNAENSKIVLYGLDQNLDDELTQNLPGYHPQFYLSRMLAELECKFSSVKNWSGEAGEHERAALISNSLLPAEQVFKWQEFSTHKKAAQGMSIATCQNQEEEAQLVSIILNEAAQSNKSAILVSADDNFIRRVKSHLSRYDLNIDDASGKTIFDLPACELMLSLLDVIRSRLSPVKLMALLKNSLVKDEFHQAAINYELRVLRRELQGIRPEKIDINDLGINIDGFEGLEKLIFTRETDLSSFFQLASKVMKNLCASEAFEGENSKFWQFAEEQVLPSLRHLGQGDQFILPDLIAELAKAEKVWSDEIAHNKIKILPPIEARFARSDIMILPSMNEGSFPSISDNDNFLNQEIRKQLGLDSLEAKISQQAHDFEILANAPQIIFTRALKEQGAQTTPSRFLQTLQALHKIPETGLYIQKLERQNAVQISKANARPEPKPPLSARPRGLSVTQIGRLMRDPYYIYASKILRLKKLPELDREPNQADFGNFIHEVIRRYEASDAQGEEAFFECAENEFKKYTHLVGLRVLWWPRLKHIAEFFLSEDSKRKQSSKVISEETKQISFSTPAGSFTLSARADRVEISDSGVNIIDYKTGSEIKEEYVQLGLEPQLPLTAIIFSENYNQQISSMEYWYLKHNKTASDFQKSINLGDVSFEDYEQEFINLVRRFDDKNMPYYSNPRPQYMLEYNDYDHLARIQEWEGAV